MDCGACVLGRGGWGGGVRYTPRVHPEEEEEEEDEEIMAELPAPADLGVEWSSSSSDESPVYATSPVFRRFTDCSVGGRGMTRPREKGKKNKQERKRTQEKQNKQAYS